MESKRLFSLSSQSQHTAKPLNRRNILRLSLSVFALYPVLRGLAQTGSNSNFSLITEGVVQSADGTPIGYLKIGSGPGLVIVHGSISTGDEWVPVANVLAERFTCYLMDRRGRGRSGDALDYSLDKECEDIKAVLDMAGPDAYLLGHSYGAICTIETANRFSVSKLVLYEAPLPITGSVIPTAFDDMKIAIENSQPEKALLIAYSKIVHESDENIARLQSTPNWNEMIALTPGWVREMQVMQDLEHGVDRFSKMSSPTLLLLGTATAPHHIAASDALDEMLPNSRTVKLQDQGHRAHLTSTVDFAKKVTNFLI